MASRISLDVLLKSIADSMTSVLNPAEEFKELCSFAEDTGWKKIGESEKGVIYKNESLGINEFTLPWPYPDYNNK